MKGSRRKEEEKEAKVLSTSKWNFVNCGPIHLKRVDWRRPDHRRSVYASLSQGVYILERDRQQKRNETDALAPPWWRYFHFQCIKKLIDKVDSSIFGAVFEQKMANASSYHRQQGNSSVPSSSSRYIVVFRGTMLEPQTKRRDLYLDSQLFINRLPYDSRYKIGFGEINKIVKNIGPKNVVLAGHSLGASIALEAGKDLAKKGCHIETYLFNPPCPSLPIEAATVASGDSHFVKDKARITRSILTAGFQHAVKTSSIHANLFSKDDNKLKVAGRIGSTILTSGLQLAVDSSIDNTITTTTTTTTNDNKIKTREQGQQQQQQHGGYEQFVSFSSWVPNLYVNPKDPVSCEYVGHFEHRKRMEGLGLHKVGHIANNTSFVSILAAGLGIESEPPHLLLSAFLTKNMAFKDQGFMNAHSVEQWWQQHSNWDSKLHIYGKGAATGENEG